MSEELTLLPCPLCQATAHVEYHNGYLRVICEGEPGCPFRMGGKRFVFTDECYDWWNNLPRALTWTDEPPKVPGCYLGRKKGGRISMVIYCFYQKDELGFWNGKKFCTFEQDATEYFGPIPEPREPKEQGGYDG